MLQERDADAAQAERQERRLWLLPAPPPLLVLRQRLGPVIAHGPAQHREIQGDSRTAQGCGANGLRGASQVPHAAGSARNHVWGVRTHHELLQTLMGQHSAMLPAAGALLRRSRQ
jgi:hypothetical protein